MTRSLHYSCPYCHKTIALVAVLTGKCVHCRRELDPELLGTMRLRYDQGHDMPAEEMTPDGPAGEWVPHQCDGHCVLAHAPGTVRGDRMWVPGRPPPPPITWDDPLTYDEQDRPARPHTVAYVAMVVATVALLLACLGLAAGLQALELAGG